MKIYPVKSSEGGLSKTAFNRVNPVKCGAYLFNRDLTPLFFSASQPSIEDLIELMFLMFHMLFQYVVVARP